ncbi:hypothetical protein H6P81_008993 [Aristolochia fimbriata]|uniref:Uncharacterized protein n=1 Tax=Aristolochia fimbriata TaxID=158543 RepID=A0AAV7EP47_ARIFI|nr:hypothetical protein H6P81_008993 [Aristolochia fimbriata]
MGAFNKEEVTAEAKKQLWLALPLIVVTMLQFSLTIVSAIFVGHLGALPLAGASMAVCFTSVTGFSVLAGMGSALDTLCGQANGAKQYHMVGIHMQRATLILLILCIPLAFIWANTYHILVLLRQEANISAEAGVFARWMILSVFAYAIHQCLCRFLQSQNNICPMMISTGITALLHILLCWILVIKFRMGGKGPAMAISISTWLNSLLLIFYVKFSSACEKTWAGFSKAALRDTMKFMRLAVPSACMVCMRSWALQLMVFMSGFLPEAKFKTSVMSIGLASLSATSIILTINFC